MIRTAFYPDAYGVAPRCAVYYVGGQDISNSHFRNLDPGYAEFHTPHLVDAMEARYADRAPVALSPILRLLRRGATSLFDTVRPAEDPAGSRSALPDPALEAIFARNIRSISAINRARGVRTIWIGELLNDAPLPPGVAPDAKWTLFIDLKDLHGLLAHLRSVLKREAAALGDIHIDLDNSKLQGSHFVDAEHFSTGGPGPSPRWSPRPSPKPADHPCEKARRPLVDRARRASRHRADRSSRRPGCLPNRLSGRLAGPWQCSSTESSI